MMRAAGDGPHGRRLRGLIVILWRAGLRIREALALAEADLDPRRGALLVRRGTAESSHLLRQAGQRGPGRAAIQLGQGLLSFVPNPRGRL